MEPGYELSAVGPDAAQGHRPPLQHIQPNHFPVNAFGQRFSLAFIFDMLEQVFENVNVFQGLGFGW